MVHWTLKVVLDLCDISFNSLQILAFNLARLAITFTCLQFKQFYYTCFMKLC
jgi:hypothetical protein